ncbi:hypothetical protein IO99_13730 [Clostridium sulfidigenes]|uniref:Phage protein n=1 Tax=Clostridium sulfidigenes TaxID=318464 RepID=A0A084J9B7_9CLOT|nr:hypothetical protein [Clostridium sulfidigenes]KEZ85551.1 hypothetical protein IO99_13730 [Clostridium sulfidigenes]
MITLLEINKAINKKIKEALKGTEFSSVPLLAEDISEPIVRPSLKVAIENSTNGKFNSNCREKNLTCRVYFFAKDRNKYKMDNSKMQDLIETAFLEDLQVTESFYIPIEEVESEVSDTVLISSFNLYSIELLPDTDISEPMEILKINI